MDTLPTLKSSDVGRYSMILKHARDPELLQCFDVDIGASVNRALSLLDDTQWITIIINVRVGPRPRFSS